MYLGEDMNDLRMVLERTRQVFGGQKRLPGEWVNNQQQQTPEMRGSVYRRRAKELVMIELVRARRSGLLGMPSRPSEKVSLEAREGSVVISWHSFIRLRSEEMIQAN